MQNTTHVVRVARRAPDFTAAAVRGDGSIDERFNLAELTGRYVALFFWPLDHTFVCPTELLAFDHRLTAFDKRDCAVVGVSIDSVYSHVHWRDTPVEQGGIGPVGFTMVSDLRGSIAEQYGVRTVEGPALRGTFLLDRDLVCRHILINDLNLGRDVDETLRTLDALQHVERFGEVCPANWHEGEAAMTPTADSTARFLQMHGAAL